ncbi:hypothetical protein ACQR05_16040 [Bradyrhizobium oligotrophicum]|uniref:hypothetical protein n=1 Tax=Bradyrhizobium oligotrophicum TaxID=44255 RepID=UPI003EBE7125
MPQDSDQGSQTNLDDKPSTSQNEIIAAITSFAERYEALQQERSEHEHSIFLWTRGATIGVGIYTLLTLGAVTLTYCALRTSQQANEIQTRPYIKIEFEPDTFTVRSANDKRGDSRVVKFRLTNIGKLPRLVLALSATDWDGPGHARSTNWPSIGESGRAFLFPDARGVEFDSQGMSITPGQIADLANGTGRLFVMVDALYGPLDSSAIPSREYETRICTSFAILSTAGELRLGEGRPCNEADSNYAK